MRVCVCWRLGFGWAGRVMLLGGVLLAARGCGWCRSCRALCMVMGMLHLIGLLFVLALLFVEVVSVWCSWPRWRV